MCLCVKVQNVDTRLFQLTFWLLVLVEKGNSLELPLFFQTASAVLSLLWGARASCPPTSMFSGRRRAAARLEGTWCKNFTLTFVQTDKSKKENEVTFSPYSHKALGAGEQFRFWSYPVGSIHACLFRVFYTLCQAFSIRHQIRCSASSCRYVERPQRSML